jgi:hypothetical protein
VVDAVSCVLSIDPGSAGKGNALAYVREGRLAEVWFERFDRKSYISCPYHFNYVVIERPQQDGRSRAARPEDLMGLAWEGALLAGAYSCLNTAALVELTPTEWKGSEPKPQMHARLWKILTPAERLVLGGERTGIAIHKAREKGALDRWSKPGVAYYPRSFDTHNLLDAAALALVYGGRLAKR